MLGYLDASVVVPIDASGEASSGGGRALPWTDGVR